MSISKWWVRLALGLSLVGAESALAATATPDPTVISSIKISKVFGTRDPWRLTVTQDPEIDDPLGLSGDKAPGQVMMCLSRGDGVCDPALQQSMVGASNDVFNQPHYLNSAEVVRSASGEPLLWVQTASLRSGDGDQLVLTQLLAYQRATDGFQRVYERSTGHNNNQEVRFIAAGPLKGDIIAAEPTDNAPFGFWVTVNKRKVGGVYSQVLRYRSATHYGDGNPLAVIDSEMPNIETKLGVWKAGQPLPLPAAGCAKPHLVKTELWCS